MRKRTQIGHALVLRILLCLTVCALIGTFPIERAHAACNANISCSQLDQCRPFETFRIPFATIRECMRQGVSPPDSWKRQGGRGAISRSGIGQLTIGNLDSPFYPSTNNQVPFSWPPNKQNNAQPDCSTYKSPYLLTPNDVLGERVAVQGTLQSSCGMSIQLEHKWLGLTKNAANAVIINDGQNELLSLRKSGNNLLQPRTFQIPEFYCRRNGDGENSQIEKIYISPHRLYAEVSDATKAIPVTVRRADNPESDGIYGRYIIMTKSGSNFIPPEPNPEYFQRNDEDDNVDPRCYSFDRLFSSEMPKGVAEMLISSWQPNMVESQSISAQSLLPDDDDGSCNTHQINYNAGMASLIIPPNVQVSTGRIASQDVYSKNTIRHRTETRTNLDDGTLQFFEPTLLTQGAEFFLSGGFGGLNEQTFVDGATLTLNPQRSVVIPVSGRIRLNSEHLMQLVDGGEIYDDLGRMIRQIQPNGRIQFDAKKPIQGAITGALALNDGTVLPTNSEGEAILAYDSRLNLECEK